MRLVLLLPPLVLLLVLLLLLPPPPPPPPAAAASPTRSFTTARPRGSVGSERNVQRTGHGTWTPGGCGDASSTSTSADGASRSGHELHGIDALGSDLIPRQIAQLRPRPRPRPRPGELRGVGEGVGGGEGMGDSGNIGIEIVESENEESGIPIPIGVEARGPGVEALLSDGGGPYKMS